MRRRRDVLLHVAPAHRRSSNPSRAPSGTPCASNPPARRMSRRRIVSSPPSRAASGPSHDNEPCRNAAHPAEQNRHTAHIRFVISISSRTSSAGAPTRRITSGNSQITSSNISASSSSPRSLCKGRLYGVSPFADPRLVTNWGRRRRDRPGSCTRRSMWSRWLFHRVHGNGLLLADVCTNATEAGGCRSGSCSPTTRGIDASRFRLREARGCLRF